MTKCKKEQIISANWKRKGITTFKNFESNQERKKFAGQLKRSGWTNVKLKSRCIK